MSLIASVLNVCVPPKEAVSKKPGPSVDVVVAVNVTSLIASVLNVFVPVKVVAATLSTKVIAPVLLVPAADTLET